MQILFCRHGQSFDFTTGCKEHQECICKCGTTHCRTVKDTCGSCRSCFLDNVEYAGGMKFDYTKGCIAYKDCDCFCNGKWECYGNNSVDNCNTCRQCSAGGLVYDTFEKFPLDRNCWQYKCFCLCNGTAYCPSSIVVNTCSKPDVCQQCDVEGRQIRGNTHFTYQRDGMDLHCRCNCDGGHVCVAELLYVREDVSISGQGISSGDGQCFTCSINGYVYAGNTKFALVRGGVNLKCECYCNGGYHCIGEANFEHLGCRRCNLYGKGYNGDSSFPLIYQGMKLSCTCSCDGSYVCYADGQLVLSCQGTECLPSSCGRCIVDGEVFNGGDQFGTVYKNRNLRCHCGCDGSYYCEGEGNLIISCFNGQCREIGCSSCSVYGQDYSGGSSFEIYHMGMKLSCKCVCGGSYECYGSDSEIVISCLSDGTGCLPNICSSCFVDNRRYTGLSEFSYTWEGIAMRCVCACDTSYYCQGVSEQIEIACFQGQCNRIGCPGCRIFGRQYTGGSAFELVYQGMLLQCTCACDSGYRCVGSSGTIVVNCVRGIGTGCLTSTCQPCFVDSRQYAGLEEFTSVYKGIDIRCTCGCDGSSYCRGVTTSIEVSCIRGVCNRIGCEECRVFGKEYPGGTQFDMIYKGLKVTCECDCSGGYICKGSSGVVVLTCVGGIGSGCLSSTCNTCTTPSGRQYRGWEVFRDEYYGITVDCTCSCDGSYFCSGVSELIEISCLGGTCTTSGCGTCTVFGQVYQGASKFNVIYTGLMLDCTCGCQGNYVCYGESNNLVIQCRDGRGNCLRPPCGTCELDGRQYAGLTEFNYLYEGVDMKCHCGCDSSVFCAGVVVNVQISCFGGRCSPVGCKNCLVFGQEYTALSSFEVIDSGYKLQCKCDCAGGYICEGYKERRCSQSSTSSCFTGTCEYCNFNGQRHAGRSVFKYDYNGIDMACTCGCDGSVFCQGVTELIEIRCIGGQCTPTNCKKCTIFGQQYEAFSSRKIIYQGLEWECTCRCDTSFICVADDRRVQCLAGRTCEIPDRCVRQCVVDSMRYSVGEVFTYMYKETIEMSCRCGCDGSSYCVGREGFEISCIGETCRPSRCDSCSIFGQEYSGDSQFEIIYTGVKMKCQCRCDSSYHCEGAGEVLDCEVGQRCLPRRCRKCRVNGQTIAGGTSFSYNYQGIDVRCNCGCDGSYSCSGVTIEIVIACQRKVGCRQISGCRTCNIFGNTYQGGSIQKFVHQGYYMECSCRCDSSYRCVGTKDEVIVDCGAGRNCFEQCRTCRIDGNTYQGNTQFDIVYEGKEMRCTCGCDGSYYCECKTDDSELSCDRRSRCTWVGCNSCVSDGLSRTVSETFRKTYDNIQLSCTCNCDGSYRCEGIEIRVVYICTANVCRREGCMPCVVEGRQYQRGEMYETRSGRIVRRCTCTCEGRSECTEIPQCTSCFVDGREYSEGQEFERVSGQSRERCRCSCDGRATCQTIERPQCQTCIIDGERYPGHSRHRIYRQGVSYICDCHCNGEVDCNIERPRCNDCIIGNRRYPGNTDFPAVVNDTSVHCNCRCDGSFTCTSNITTCQSTGSCSCGTCSIDSQVFQGNTYFRANVFGESMQCDCKCQGDYTCRSETKTCSYSAGCENTCRMCIVEGRQYQGGKTFDTVIQGHNVRCTCDCEGNYRCEGGGYVCTTQQQRCVRQCSPCSISGREFQGDSRFETTIDGYRVQCTCDCNGNYMCEGIQERVTCSTQRPKCTLQCGSCTISGRSYGGSESSFNAVVEGTMMQCQCDCGGNYECRGGNRICTNRGCVSDCSKCVIDTQTFSAVDTDFMADVFGYRMSCRCSCDGGYRCANDQRVCTHSTGCVDLCVGCEIEGNIYEGNSRFSIFHKAYNVQMQCECQCGGSYTCRGTINVPSCVGSSCPMGDQCNDCVIDGRSYSGNSEFQTIIDGIRVNCTCSCNGGYSCLGKEEKCYGDGCYRDGSCHSCFIQGRNYRGNSQFEIESESGIRMKCTCDCSGHYSCRGTKESVVCVGSGCSANPSTCRECFVDGQRYRGGSTFQRTSANGILMDCTCSCDGVSKCEGRQICSGPRCGSTQGCKRCVIDGIPYTGNTRFTFEKGDATYTCVCFCDGSHSCETDGGIGISCLGDDCAADTCRPCKLDNREYQLDAKFRLQKNDFIMNCVCECDGAYRCFSISGSCRGEECDDYGCSSCIIEGKSYKAGSVVETSRGLVCTCDCSGNYHCRTKSLSIQCVGSDCGTGNCKQCFIDNEYYKGDSRFVFKNYGLHMSCACNCDSSYTCRGYQIIAAGETTDLDGCISCIVDGQRINGNTRFQTLIGGQRKDCSCSCSGKYFCHDIDECRECAIGTDRYTPNQAFTLTRNDQSIKCRCECNGNFICQGRRVVSGGFDGCSECTIFGVTYRGDTRFTTDVGDVRMLCECRCTGEYVCRGYRTITSVLLPGERQEVCEECQVGSQTFSGNSNFILNRGCWSVECFCGCNGFFDCRYQTPKYTCGIEEEYGERGILRRYSIAGSRVFTSGETAVKSQDSTVIVSQSETFSTCSSCSINEKLFQANAQFVLEDSCLRWESVCQCNGFVNFTSVVGTDCDGPFDEFEQKRCFNCIAFGNTYPPNQEFTLVRDCDLFTCMCYCNGTFNCPPEKTVQTCKPQPQRTVISLRPSSIGSSNSRTSSFSREISQSDSADSLSSSKSSSYFEALSSSSSASSKF